MGCLNTKIVPNEDLEPPKSQLTWNELLAKQNSKLNLLRRISSEFIYTNIGKRISNTVRVMFVT